MNSTKNPQKKRRGQAMSEYLILTALIAVASIGIVQLLGFNIRSRLAMISNAIGGSSSQRIEGKRATQEHYKVRDLGDFSEGAQDNQ